MLLFPTVAPKMSIPKIFATVCASGSLAMLFMTITDAMVFVTHQLSFNVRRAPAGLSRRRLPSQHSPFGLLPMARNPTPAKREVKAHSCSASSYIDQSPLMPCSSAQSSRPAAMRGNGRSWPPPIQSTHAQIVHHLKMRYQPCRRKLYPRQKNISMYSMKR